jgi:hypothetical protein
MHAHLCPPLGSLDQPSLSSPFLTLGDLSDLNLRPPTAELVRMGEPADTECIVDRGPVQEAKDLEVGLGLRAQGMRMEKSGLSDV